MKSEMGKGVHMEIVSMTANKRKILCLDIETTGFSQSDEILQMSIIDGEMNVLFNQYFKPSKKETWPKAQAINHISPEMVASERPFSEYSKDITAILSSAYMICGYNSDFFDIPFLKRYKVSCPNVPSFDAMKMFQLVTKSKHAQKLTECAEYYHFDFQAHDSLEDTKATMYCTLKMLEGEAVIRSLYKLPVSKELVYQEKTGLKQYLVRQIKTLQIVQMYPSGSCSFVITTDDGQEVRILSDYLAEMQKGNFQSLADVVD